MKEYKAYAKVNIFLKITGMRDNYHEIISRFMKVNSLFDVLSFIPKEDKEFSIVGDFACTVQENTIYKAYQALLDFTSSDALKLLMQKNAIKVEKSIPAFAGLGGGSSDAATFLHMCNDTLDLGLSLDTLASIGLKVGADVPFFIYNYESANVSGIGEIVEEFKEEPLSFEVFTPDVKISTPFVYKTYRKHFFAPIDADDVKEYKDMNSLAVLNKMDAYEANDLFAPAMKEYSGLEQHYKKDWHFSGSGSSFFRIKSC